jgi:uncharacterized FlgJ-related protein
MKILIIEPSRDGSLEFGHTREGIRYLASRFSQADVTISVAKSESLFKNSNNYKLIDFRQESSISEKINAFFKITVKFITMSNYRIIDSRLWRAALSREINNRKYKKLRSYDMDKVIFQDVSFQSLPFVENVNNKNKLCLRVIGKPPKHLEDIFLKEFWKRR